MPSLKDMRARMNSVRQTRKITSAMKLVAASKLRRAQEQAEASRPFAERMSAMLQNLAAGVAGLPGAPPLLAGTGKDEVHLLIVATADRGLCGGFNSTIVRGARRRIQELLGAGQAGQAHRRRQEGPRHAAPRPARPHRRVLRRHRRQAADRVRRRAAGHRARARAVRGRRVRRLHADLQQVQVGGDADPDLPAAGARADAAAGRGQAARPARAARSTSSSPTRSASWASSCRATWRCSCSGRCSRTRPASRVRAWPPWTAPPATRAR